MRRSASISRTLLSWSCRFTVASASVRSSTRCSRSASSRSRCVWKVSRRASNRQPRAARIIAKVITTAATASPRSRCRASRTRSCPSSSGSANATTMRPGAIAGSRWAPRSRASVCAEAASTPTLLAASRVTVSTAMPGNAGASARREASNERATTASQLMANVVPAPSRSTAFPDLTRPRQRRQADGEEHERQRGDRRLPTGHRVVVREVDAEPPLDAPSRAGGVLAEGRERDHRGEPGEHREPPSRRRVVTGADERQADADAHEPERGPGHHHPPSRHDAGGRDEAPPTSCRAPRQR